MKFSKLQMGIAAFFAVGTAAMGIAAQSETPEMLQSLERGLWQFRAVGGGASPAGISQICVNDPRLLAQLKHNANSQCSHFVVRSSPSSVTISYSCKGAGQGLTTIRKESPRLIQIQSQGIQNGSPFSFSLEGRRSAACGT
jgi:hypothetical protein